MKILWGLLVLMITFSTCYAQSPIIYDSLEDAVALSESTNTDILVIFGAVWCKQCQVLKGELDNNPDKINKFIVCYVNIDNRPDLAKEYRVRMVPDSLVLSKKVEKKRIVGFKNKNIFFEWLNNVK